MHGSQMRAYNPHTHPCKKCQQQTQRLNNRTGTTPTLLRRSTILQYSLLVTPLSRTEKKKVPGTLARRTLQDMRNQTFDRPNLESADCG